jgi:hypothetical protein
MTPVSVMMLLCSEEPLMKRCISTGGTALLLKPLPPPVTESAYQQITEAFGLADKSPEDRIKALLEIPVNDLWQKVPRGVPLLPSTLCLLKMNVQSFLCLARSGAPP